MGTTMIFHPEQHGFFDDLATMLISLSSYLFTMHVSMASNVPTPYHEIPWSEYLSYIAPIKDLRYPLALDRFHDNNSLVIFPTMLVIITSLNRWPQFIEYELEPIKRTNPDHRLTSQGNKKISSSIVGASFVSYYSRCESKVRDLYGEKANWPPAWHFAWAVRNGFAHGGKIRITDRKLPPVRWKVWSLDHSDNDRGVLFDDGMLGIGDLIALMEDMDNCLRDN